MPGAVVLCGGRSRRMGQPKAWIPFGHEPMLQRVVRLVRQTAAPIVVVAAPGQECPPLPDDVTIVRDPVADRGPLLGLAAGLAALPDHVELAFASATDAPLLEPRWITRLEELIGDHDVAIPYVDGFHHPLSALYRRSTILPHVEQLLREDRLRLLDLVQRVRTRIVAADELRVVDPYLRTLRNLNTLKDLKDALDDAGLPTTL